MSSGAHSLATATGTNIETLARHNVPCKVATDYLTSLISSTCDNPSRELQLNKHKYSMAKDDIVVGLGRPMYGSSVNANKKKAYPSVITTLAQMEPEVRRWLAVHNFMCTSYHDAENYRKRFVNVIASEAEPINDNAKAAWKLLGTQAERKKHIQFQINNLLEFFVVGVSLGTAYAHPSSGDTVATVMIGSLKTIQNGAFPMHTNDLVCIYEEDERALFEDNGGRKDRSVFLNEAGTDLDFEKICDWIKNDHINHQHVSLLPNGMERLRKDYYDRGNGNYPATPTEGKQVGKIHIFRIKPYIVSRHIDPDTRQPQHFPQDKARIFAKAISNAQPYERCDIMIARQSI